jgi:1-acyl-sn-glycerol-3-phosphate acyltransferase
MHHSIARSILGIRSRVVGTLPTEPCLIAVKHESMYETLEMLRLSNLPVVVIKRELADMPLFGALSGRPAQRRCARCSRPARKRSRPGAA